MKSTWPAASTLAERRRLLAAHPELRRAPGERARRGLARFRAQEPFAADALWQRRLGQAGLAESELAEILEVPWETLGEAVGPPPPWARRVIEAYGDGRPAAPLPVDAELLERAPQLGFLHWAAPLLERARGELEAGLDALLARPGEPPPVERHEVWRLISPVLCLRLQKMIDRTAVLELNVARLDGTLAGATPEERFASFIARLEDPVRALALWGEYPVLARKVALYLERSIGAILELLDRLAADGPEIRRLLGAGEPGRLTALHVGAGDRHRGGRSVVILTFDSGFQVVYKPSPQAVGRHFQALLGWVNGSGAVPPCRQLRILDRGTYGWVEFVEAESCREPPEIERFYLRLGGYLALLHAFEATDFHYENLIAAGEQPVLVDLESFFTPPWEEERPGATRAERELCRSALRTGLLPFQLGIGAQGERLDISGLSKVRDTLAPMPSLIVRQAGTDEMSVGFKRLPMAEGQNRPRLGGEDVDLFAYAEPFARGFAAVYDLLLERRGELLAEGGLLSRFAGDEVRVLARLTATYLHLITYSYHPDVLRDGLDQERHWDRLWLGVEKQPFLEPLLPAERAACAGDDVPLFTTRPGARDLEAGAGEHLAGYFQVSGLERVRERLATLSPEDRDRQRWFLHASLATLQAETARPARRELAFGGAAAPREAFLAAAGAIGRRLAESAFRDDREGGGAGEASWLGLTLRDGERLVLLPLDLDLYSGLPGLALFLGYLGEMAGDAEATRLARATAAAVLARLDRPSAILGRLGAFTGAGGSIYVLAHLGGLWRAPDLLDAAERLAHRLAPTIEADAELDLVGGAAGYLAAVLALHRRRPSPENLDLARRAGDHLLRTAVPAGPGLGWQGSHSRPLTGFSHGASGVACTLGELARRTGEARWLPAIEGAMAFERSTFDAGRRGWPDLRAFPDAPAVAPPPAPAAEVVAWCNGAAGIGLARARLLDLLPELGGELEEALRQTEAAGFGFNHSLCHGDLGNLEPFLEAARAGDASAAERAGRLAAAILDGGRRHGWTCGVPTGVETPGLMTGLAGIGYGLLRLADPQRVPSVLALET